MSIFPKIIRIACIILAALVTCIVGGAIALNIFISPDTLRDQAEKSLSASMGRVITITGPVDISFFPNIAVSFEGFSMSQAHKLDSTKPMVQIQKATARLKILPLLTGTAEFDHVDITGLTVYTMHKASKQNTATLTCNVTASGQAHYDLAQGFTPEAAKVAVTSETQLDIRDIVLLDQDLVNQLSQSFGGSDWQKFESLSATITTNNGIVNSDNIKLVSTNINGTGIANINLITEALAGEAKLNVRGMTLPVYVKGTLSKPKFGIATGDAVNALFQSLGLTSETKNGTDKDASTSNTSSSSKSSTTQKVLNGLGTFFNKVGQ